MTGGRLVDASPFTLLTRGLQLLLAGLAAYGALRGRPTLLVNAVLSLAVTFVPAGLSRGYGHRTDPRLRLWIALAAAIHTVGFMGFYGTQSGVLTLYDQGAHAVSAALVAGVAYAVLAAVDRTSDGIRLPDGFRVVFTLCLVMAVGVGWEIAEFTVGIVASLLVDEEILVQYGVSDIVSDLLFNTLAGAVVAVWGTQYFRGLSQLFTRVLSTVRDS